MTTKCNSCGKAISVAICPYCKVVDRELFAEEKNVLKNERKAKIHDFVIIIFAVISVMMGGIFLFDVLNPDTPYVTFAYFYVEIIFYFVVTAILVRWFVHRRKKTEYSEKYEINQAKIKSVFQRLDFFA